jgi:hypothetical protein
MLFVLDNALVLPIKKIQSQKPSYLKDALNSLGVTLVFALNNLFKDCACSKPNS